VTDQTIVTINSIDYNVTHLGDSELEVLNLMANSIYSTVSTQSNSDQLDAACRAFIEAQVNNVE
jgi:hypothetical protein